MANVLRLYQITDTTKSGKDRAVPNLYFNDKGRAKAKRKELNETETRTNLRFVVSPGPDHRNYKS